MHPGRVLARCVAASIAVALLTGLAAAPARADDPPGKSPPPEDTAKDPAAKDPPAKDPPSKDAPAKDAVKPAPAAPGDPPAGEPSTKDASAKKPSAGEERPESRVDRAKKLVREIEVSLASARAAQPQDAELVKSLERSLEIARSLAKPLTLDDLSEKERRDLTEEVRKQLEPAGLPEKSAVSDALKGWEENAVVKAFEGADLSEDERSRGRSIITEWFAATGPARTAADWKRVNDLKRDRDDRLVHALGKRKALRVINNLNAMSGWGPSRK